jgi:spermidine synthase
LSLGWKWFVEYQTPHSAHMHGIKRTLHSERTKFQQIDIVETYEYGRMLVLDGKVQSTVRDEYIYHESLVHPVMLAHLNPRDILIVGGGEGGTLREVLRYPGVRRAVMVDIDEGVIKSSKKYMPELSDGAFEGKRAEVVVGDGRKYVDRCKEQFDVIIMDVTDPLEGGPGQLLYTKEFYEAAHRVLRNDGILVTQATSTYYSVFCFSTIYRTIRKVFGKAGGYQVWVPSYDSMWGFVYGTRGPDPKEMQSVRLDGEIRKRKIKGLRYYCGEIHSSLFALPKEVLEGMERKKEIATDAKPTFMPI